MTAETMAAVQEAPGSVRTPSAQGRLLGIDVARAVAQLGMLITHYTYFDGSGGDLRGVTRFFNGKAMPLFVFLGGLGFTMLTRRAAHPVAQALARGGVLVVTGLLLVEHAPLIAVILQFYGVFFALGLLVRRLPGLWLLVLAVVTMLVGGWSWLYLAPDRVRYGGWAGWETVADPRPLLIDILVSGSYPALPTFSFFLVGMWVGRQALGRRNVQVALLVAGLALALVGFVGGEIVTRATTDRQELTHAISRDDGAAADRIAGRVERRGESRRDAVRVVVRERERADGTAPLARFADPVGHGKMPAWVIGATGWSLTVLGLCLLAYARWPRMLRPVALAGQLALTFYVLQALGLRWWYTKEWSKRYSYTGQLVACLLFFAVFVVLATIWRRFLSRGPLEALLRMSGNAASTLAGRLSVGPGR
jgi:uncharacterized membrane protein